MKMPISELGERMSNYELCVTWPAYFSERRKHEIREENKRADR